MSESHPYQVHVPGRVDDGAPEHWVGEGARPRDDGRHDRGADGVVQLLLSETAVLPRFSYKVEFVSRSTILKKNI